MKKLYALEADEKINWWQSLAFFIVHIMPLFAIFTGVRWIDVALLFILYYVRMFFITAGYHRYFAHRAFKMGRIMQFIFAFMAQTSAQKGVLWWSGYHRHHHKTSDSIEDIHSPLRGFWWSHIGWILCDKYKKPPYHLIKDFAKYPELRWLDQNDLVPAIILGAVILFVFGPSALFIGFFLSTVFLWHGTFFINSLAHVFGRRRFVTHDSSRNSFLLTLLTLGEGWHNNHHHYRSSARQGFYWWEIDITFYVLKLMNWMGLVWDLQPVPKKVKEINRIKDGHFDIGMFKNHWIKAQDIFISAQGQASDILAERRKQFAEALENGTLKAEELAKLSREELQKVHRIMQVE